MARFNHQRDEFDYEYVEYEFYPGDEELKEAIVEIMVDTYFSFEDWGSFNSKQKMAIEKVFRNINNDNDNWEELCENYKDELKEYFEEQAREEMRE
jgi:hypothetical protein